MSHHLAERLREGTRQSHTAAENTAFMKCFLKGIVERDPFRKLLANLFEVYQALETEMQRHKDHPVVGAMIFPDLLRVSALAQDLAYYYGSDEPARPLPAGQVYVDRIHEVADKAPELLVAHAYTRYMGDLSGGQALRAIARTAMNLPADQGTAFHEFTQLPTPEARRAFKAQYRNALDALPIDEETVQRIIDEANYAFQLNRDLVHDLEDEVKAAIGEHVFDLLTRQTIPGATERSPQALPHEGHPVGIPEHSL
ncbi:biliverdin-producing heme oxygenase [Lyngbya confervoides]|uniref:heme oxygenase (biliverdin-producing) n=1 Tax=Lyngbya confervoides BDU141951 TaxID=1574623 RepID=A0ABD4T4M9_9CYAN|nr:heme oxygenase (biliverdin-producing) [Lyngbya confervoides]MCM1983643.1 heme oxygenase (biliverdin-producing) [Lyngbya confervoides BDU141951]